MTSRPGPKGSPRLNLAALTLATDSNKLTIKEALLKSGYKESEINRAKVQAASKRKCRIIDDVLRKKKQAKRSEYYVNATLKKNSNVESVGASSVSSIIDEFSERVQQHQQQVQQQRQQQPTDSRCHRKTKENKENLNPAKKPMNKRSKALSKNSRRTSKQLNAYLAEKNEADSLKKKAYQWAVRQVLDKTVKTASEAARRATELFDITVLPDTIRKLVKKDQDTISRSGPKGKFTEEEMGVLEVAVLSYVSLSQANCAKEKTCADLSDLIKSVVEKAAEGRQLQDTRAFWRRLQGRLASNISLDSESLIELRRQIWTTYGNLNAWYDGWEKFIVDKGFATKEADGTVTFSEQQKRRIINLDETKMSLDGSDGGIGGRPANVIVVKNAFRAGTATNKTSISSTLMCGSNSAGT